nr:MAG TPA: hypothetical protein [Caudoviricetes sp.]
MLSNIYIKKLWGRNFSYPIFRFFHSFFMNFHLS